MFCITGDIVTGSIESDPQAFYTKKQINSRKNNMLCISSLRGATSEGATICPETMYVFDSCAIAYGRKAYIKRRIAKAMLKTSKSTSM